MSTMLGHLLFARLDGIIMTFHVAASGFHGGASSSRVSSRAYLADSITAHHQSLRASHPRQRSVGRRVKNRLILGTAALALFGLTLRIIPDESPAVTSSIDAPPVHEIEKSQDRFVSVRPGISILPTPTMPNWLRSVLNAPAPATFRPTAPAVVDPFRR